jgi:hypothetical protein
LFWERGALGRVAVRDDHADGQELVHALGVSSAHGIRQLHLPIPHVRIQHAEEKQHRREAAPHALRGKVGNVGKRAVDVLLIVARRSRCANHVFHGFELSRLSGSDHAVLELPLVLVLAA